MIRTYVASPYSHPTAAGRLVRVMYARLCTADAVARGEATYTPHVYLTQLGILDDSVPRDRELAFAANKVWLPTCQRFAAYVDLGVSSGMVTEAGWADEHGVEVVPPRSLGSKADVHAMIWRLIRREQAALPGLVDLTQALSELGLADGRIG